MDLSLHHALARARMCQADRAGLRCQRFQRVGAGRVEVEQLGNEGTAGGVNLDPVDGAVIEVADRRLRRPVALLGLLP
ncbi:MAG: hypothetical protein ABL993_09095 [Vicinamibacterales bacterium]